MGKKDINFDELTNQQKIIELFCDDEVDENQLYSGTVLRKFIGLEDSPLDDEPRLKGKCFIGVNVKTSSSQGLRPISFRTNEKENDYVAKPETIAEGGKITDWENPEEEVNFRWDPSKWDANLENKPDGSDGIYEDNTGAVIDHQNEGLIKLFKSPYGPEGVNGGKYNVLGDIYNNALQLEGECWVWICHFDYDQYNGKFLSFVLAVGDKMEDLNTLFMGMPNSGGFDSPRHQLRNFIMLVKSRYVRQLERQRQVESVKSAVAAIMSRNMSHNLGSHYLYYTKTQLAALADKNEMYGPDIRGAAKVLGYMQARMDYLATIVSGDRYPYGSVFFKGQIFDELTIDDFSKRHFEDGKDDDGRERKFKRTTNYLLQNLILSENFSRDPVIEGMESPLTEDGTKKKIRLQVVLSGTGTFNGIKGEYKEKTKLEVSKLLIALPGGIMSIHAFFNLVENFIRNSAKYLKEDFKEELVITVAIKEEAADEKRKLPERYEFIVFDNKGNAFSRNLEGVTLIDQMNQKLRELRILYDDNALDKSDKGLKEMLFSTLWMCAYTYSDEKSKKLPYILADLDRKKGDAKLEEIKQHAFEYVAVNDAGNVTILGVKRQSKVTKGEKNPGKGVKALFHKFTDVLGTFVPTLSPVADPVECSDEDTVEEESANLGIRFELPKFRMMTNVDAEVLEKDLIERGVNNFTDILCTNATSEEQIKSLKEKFTRVYLKFANNVNDEGEAVEIFKEILKERFDNFEDFRLSMTNRFESGFDGRDFDKRNRGIYLRRHISDLGEMDKYAYCEAISGENFTNTLQEIFETGYKGSRYKEKFSEFFALKIKEAALTRITLIDERLYNDMIKHKDKEKETVLKLKNIRVSSLRKTISNDNVIVNDDGTLNVQEIFEGKPFRDNTYATHFLSIHLGLIEKIVKDDSPWVKAHPELQQRENLSKRVEKFMEELKNTFKSDKGEIFISVHSGRGNFSKELDESLREYAFISISAIESVYSNSKFLLAQLFYNTVYIGKGVTNSNQQ